MGKPVRVKQLLQDNRSKKWSQLKETLTKTVIAPKNELGEPVKCIKKPLFQRPEKNPNAPQPQAAIPVFEHVVEKEGPVVLEFSIAKLTDEEKRLEKERERFEKLGPYAGLFVLKTRHVRNSVKGMFKHFGGGKNHEWGRMRVA